MACQLLPQPTRRAKPTWLNLVTTTLFTDSVRSMALTAHRSHGHCTALPIRTSLFPSSLLIELVFVVSLVVDENNCESRGCRFESLEANIPTMNMNVWTLVMHFSLTNVCDIHKCTSIELLHLRLGQLVSIVSGYLYFFYYFVSRDKSKRHII